MMYKKLFLILIVALGAFSGKAQLKGIVLDAASNEPMPFVNVYDPNQKIGDVTNVNGAFEFDYTPSVIEVSFVGYTKKIVEVEGHQVLVRLEQEDQQLREVNISPGVNPAIRIIDNTINNKKINQPEGEQGYVCNTFTTFKVHGKFDEVKNIDSLLQNDSTFIDAYQFLQKQHIFLMETAAERIYKPPSKVRENILATKTAGLENPMFAAMATQFQSFSFYDNYIHIFDNDLLSPISNGALSRYIYEIKEQNVNAKGDSISIIYFQPQKNTSFKGLKGLLFINHRTWALTKVSAKPVNAAEGQLLSLQNLTITQEYEEVAENKWFPKDLKLEIATDALSVNGLPVRMENRTVVKDVSFDPEYDTLKLGAVQVNVAKDANKKDSLFWREKRGRDLLQKEKKTYQTIDSLSQANNLERRLNGVIALATGKIRIKFIDLDLLQLIDYNNHEGFRLGLGLNTNENLIPWMQIGGHFAYGFKDKTFKYGGFLDFDLYQPREVKLKLSYDKDVKAVGNRPLDIRNSLLNPTELYSNFFIEDMDDFQRVKAKLSGNLTAGMNIAVFSSYARYFSNQPNYIFKESSLGQKFDDLAIGLEYHWEVNPKKIQLPSGLLTVRQGNPKLYFRIKQGIATSFSDVNYTHLMLRFDHTLPLRGWGSFQYQVNGQMVLESPPRTHLFYGNGTNKGFGIVAANTFETMIPLEFLSDQSGALHISYETPSLKTKIEKWFKPSITLRSSAGWGALGNPEDHQGIDFKTMEQGYFESGIVINKIFRLNTLGFGFGTFYRYGPYTFPDLIDNFAFKLSLTIDSVF